MFIIIILFACLLIVNVYFRLKVIKAFRNLRDLKIQPDSSALFNKNKFQSFLKTIPVQHQSMVQQFSDNLRYSISMAVALVILIAIFGGVLMYYRNHA